MKGMYFQKPLQLNLLVNGESWHQGDPVAGSLTVKNLGPDDVPSSEVRVHLAYGELKKVRQKSPDAYEVLTSVPMEKGGKIAPGQEATLAWRFETDRNTPITDASRSLFVLYGRGGSPIELGSLQLTVDPTPVVQEFLSSLQTEHRFVLKSRKFLRGATEVKLAPPDSRELASVEHLTLAFRFEGEDLRVGYEFRVRKIEAGAATFDVAKQKKTLEQVFKPEEYRTPTGRFNHERIEGAIKAALSTVAAKIVF